MASTKERSLFARFRLNAMSHGYAQIITVLAQLVQVPFFLRAWGETGYSDWLVLTGIPMLFILLDLGVAQASANRATISAAAGDWPTARCSMQTSLVFTLGLCGLILLATAAGNQAIDWVALLKLHTLSQSDAVIIVYMMALCLVTALPCGPLEAWYRVMDRAALGAFLIANRRLADIIVTLSVLLLGGSAVDLAIALFAAQAVLMVIFTIIAVRLSPQPMLGLRDASMQEFRTILRPALSYASFPISQAVTLQGGLQVLNQVSDASVVVGYTMTRTLVRFIIQFGVVANNALKPELSRLAGQGKMAEATAFTATMGKRILILCGALYVGVIAAGPEVIRLWSHGAVHVGRWDIALIGAHALLNVAWFIPAALLIATNAHTRVAVVYGISSTAALGLWLLGVHHIAPITGAALLLAIPELCTLVAIYIHLAARRKPEANIDSATHRADHSTRPAAGPLMRPQEEHQ